MNPVEFWVAFGAWATVLVFAMAMLLVGYLYGFKKGYRWIARVMDKSMDVVLTAEQIDAVLQELDRQLKGGRV